jgi:hypothetical protein
MKSMNERLWLGVSHLADLNNWSRRETGRQSPAAVLHRWVIVAEIKRQPQGRGLARHFGPSVSTRMLVPAVAFI